MVSSLLKSLVVGTLAIVSRANVLTGKHHGPVVWDGQYTHPNATNNLTEWKFFQILADPVGGKAPASFSVTFYQGYALGARPPNAPESYISVTASFANGTTASLVVPAESSSITAHGQTVHGKWGSVGSFTGSPDLSTYTATFTAPQYGLEGSFKITSQGTRHLGCNTTTDVTFASASPSNCELTPEEKYVFEDTVWVTTIPRGRASAHLTIQGSKLDIYGQGYHDMNAAPGPVNPAVDTWYAGVGQCGAYDLAWIYVAPLNSTNILTSGYLARNDVVLQQQCSVNGAKTKDAVTMTPYGIANDTVAGDQVPAGFVVQYTLKHGEKFRFNFTSINNTQVPDANFYHRFVGQVEGGKVGEKPCRGPFLYEWLNPQLKAYVPPS